MHLAVCRLYSSAIIIQHFATPVFSHRFKRPRFCFSEGPAQCPTSHASLCWCCFSLVVVAITSMDWLQLSSRHNDRSSKSSPFARLFNNAASRYCKDTEIHSLTITVQNFMHAQAGHGDIEKTFAAHASSEAICCAG